MAQRRRKPRTMDEVTLKAVVQAERAAAMGSTGTEASDLVAQRSKAMDYYQGDMADDMPALEGRSKAVSTDVADTVDGIMPSLMDIFAGSDEIAKFMAVGEEDEPAAQQETDYVNHVFWQENHGFRILHAMMKDALIQKNGIVKFWWEEGEDEERETYRNQAPDGFALLALDEQEGRIEIIEHTENPDGTHDVVVIKRRPYGCVKVKEVPPEEFGIARDARDIQGARYCRHTVKRTRSELIEQGYDKEIVDQLPTGTSPQTTEGQSRATVNDNDSSETTADVNRQMQEIEVTEHYLRVDYDGDGVAELRKVTTAGTGDTILDNEPFDRMPFAAITPQLMSHRFWGRSLADIVMDLQQIKTALVRAALDSAYFANSQRIEVAESHAGDHTIDDLLTNRPGSVVRTKMPGGILPIPSTSVAGEIYPALEYFDTTREIRTGIQRNAVGPDANSLNPYNRTATGANILATSAQQRIRLIARTFAETGIKDLFLGIHELILKHGKSARQVKLRDKWQIVDPRNWKTRKDMTVMIGLGTGTRDQVMAYLMQILNMQIQALQMQGGAAGPIVKLTNVYNTLRKLVENAGFRSADPFFSAPTPQDEQQSAQPKPDPKMAEAQAKIALKQQEMQADQQAQQAQIAADAQAQQQKLAAEMQAERERAAQDMMIEKMRLAMEAAMERQRAAQDAALARYEAQLEAQTKLMIGRMEAQVALLKPDTQPREGGSPGA
jgi:hypothetical protein